MLADHIPHTTKRWDVVIPGEPVAWQRAGRSRRGGQEAEPEPQAEDDFVPPTDEPGSDG